MIVRLGKSLKLDLPVRMDDEMLTIAGLAKVVDEIAATQSGTALRTAPIDSRGGCQTPVGSVLSDAG